MTQWIRVWWPVILWCALIFFLSAQPRLPGPEDVTLDFFVKKMGHISVYAVLFALVYRSFGSTTAYRMQKTALFCLLYAVSDEWHQSFVPGRTPMLRDIGFDIVGMLLASVSLKRKLFRW